MLGGGGQEHGLSAARGAFTLGAPSKSCSDESPSPRLRGQATFHPLGSAVVYTLGPLRPRCGLGECIPANNYSDSFPLANRSPITLWPNQTAPTF